MRPSYRGIWYNIERPTVSIAREAAIVMFRPGVVRPSTSRVDGDFVSYDLAMEGDLFVIPGLVMQRGLLTTGNGWFAGKEHGRTFSAGFVTGRRLT